MIKSNGGIIGPDNVTTGGAFGRASGVFKLGEVTDLIKQSKWPTAGPGGFQVANSARFNQGSSEYLRRSLGTTTSQQKGTFSYWVKRSDLGDTQIHYSNEVANDNNRGYLSFESGDAWRSVIVASGSTEIVVKTNRLFRDVSAWYHIVVRIDTTQSTSTNRLRLYVNGVQETSFNGYQICDQNATLKIFEGGQTNKNLIAGIYASGSASDYLGGYLSEFVYCDGQTLDPTSFGEFNSQTGIWVPKDVTGLTFGNMGFYLDFKDSSALGNDAAGSNNWSVVNLASLDQSTDTCTTNFATLNPLALRNNPNAYYAVLSQGNLKLKGNATTNNGNSFSTMAFDTGKWYCEVKMIDADNSLFPILGVIPEDLAASANSPSNSGQIGTVGSDTVGYSPDGQKIIAGNETSYGDTFTNNDIIGIAIDCDNGAVYFSKNGTFQASGDPTSGASKTGAALTFTPSKTYFFGASVYKDTNDIEFNFGSPTFAISSGNTDGNGFGNFEYAVPTGYLSLNTKNLAAVLA